MIATITLSNSGTDLAAGTTVDTNSLPFNHRAKSFALQMRADGYDIRIYGPSGAAAGLVAIVGTQTTSCRVKFNLTADLPNGDTQTYTMHYGNLGSYTNPYTATASGDAALGMAISFPDPVLPCPSFPFAETWVDDVDVLLSSQSPTVRTARRNVNRHKRYSLTWRSIPPETAYEIRAWVYARGGGNTTFTESTASFLAAGKYRMVPGTLQIEQMTRVQWNIGFDVEGVDL